MTHKELSTIKQYALKAYAGSIGNSHDLEHIRNVYKNASYLAKKHAIKVDTNLLEAICYLHDLTYTKYSVGLRAWLFESRYVKKELDTIFHAGNVSINDDDKQILYDAVVNHPHSFPFRVLNKQRSIYAQLLQDADTVELFRLQRISHLPKKFIVVVPLILLSVYILKKSKRFFMNLE